MQRRITFLKAVLVLTVIQFTSQIQAQNLMKIPPYLTKGDTVAIVATARKIEAQHLQPAIDLLKSWGLNVVLGKTIGKENNQLAGADWQRATDFQERMVDRSKKAVWCAKGGNGPVRRIDGEKLATSKN